MSLCLVYVFPASLGIFPVRISINQQQYRDTEVHRSQCVLGDLSIILSFVSHSQIPHWGYVLLWILLLLWEISFSVFANPSYRLLLVPWICHKQVLKCWGGLLCFIRRQGKSTRQLFHVGKLFSEVSIQLSFLTYFISGVHWPWKEQSRKDQCKQANRIICNESVIKVTCNSRPELWHGRGAPDHVQMEVSRFQGAGLVPRGVKIPVCKVCANCCSKSKLPYQEGWDVYLRLFPPPQSW